MNAEWGWYRFEFELMRASINSRGLPKLKIDPDLCIISEVALKGHNAQEKLSTNNFDSENDSDLKRRVHEGNFAED